MVWIAALCALLVPALAVRLNMPGPIPHYLRGVSSQLPNWNATYNAQVRAYRALEALILSS